MSARSFRSLSLSEREARAAELVRAVRAGDQSAWDELVECYVALLWSIAYRHGLHETDAADVVQTTWLRLMEHIHDLRDPSKVGAWLATTAQREALRCVGHNHRLVLNDDDAAFDGPDLLAAPVDERLLAQERATAAFAALGSLPPAWRTLIQLLTQDPAPSYEQISKELNIPVGSIGPTRGRCVRKIRDILNAAN
jgi:RNA polymerase sigma factor (sigma-70 family)